MKKTLLATAATALLASTAAQADEVRFGVLLGFTGPLESITPLMADAAELAFREASESGQFLGGTTIAPVRADSSCLDNSVAVASAERLISAEGVVGIMGADCSGVTMGVLQNVAIPNGIPMISPSATSPAFTTTDSGGLFYRTSPSDARQGQVLADILADRGISSAAVTYTNNDYGLGLADSFIASFEAQGGTVTISAPHEDGRGDYSAEVGSLAAAGGEVLAVFGYVDLGGMGIIQTSVETGAFETFVLGDGMYGTSLINAIGPDLDGTFGSVPWAEGEASDAFEAFAAEHGVDSSGSYTRESYDAAALLVLAAQAAGEATPEGIAANIMNVANAPGEEIMPGELARGLEILANGGEVNYIGASTDELIEPGEAAGSYREYEVQDGAFTTVRFR